MSTSVGTRLRSAVSDVEVMVVRAPDPPVVLTCAGEPMTSEPVEPAAERPSAPADVFVGKRYVDADGKLEVLCIKAGTGPLAVNGAVLAMKEAKPLPSSD